MKQQKNMHKNALEKELYRIEKAEARMCFQMKQKTAPVWKEKLQEKIPHKVMAGLQRAFSKAFYLIFSKGVVLIEKTYDKTSIEKEFLINDYAVNIKGGRKELVRLKRDAKGGNTINTVLTTVEGIGLGILGIGLPDIVLWMSVLFRGIYEIALKYGFAYDTPEEKMYILKLLEAAMVSGQNWVSINSEVDNYIVESCHVTPTDTELKEQIDKTADAFATDMLVMKFIQGLPIIGIIGGAGNPIYYRRIMKYVQLKYQKRYLLSKM